MLAVVVVVGMFEAVVADTWVASRIVLYSDCIVVVGVVVVGGVAGTEVPHREAVVDNHVVVDVSAVADNHIVVVVHIAVVVGVEREYEMDVNDIGAVAVRNSSDK